MPHFDRRIKIKALAAEVAQSDDSSDVLERAIGPLRGSGLGIELHALVGLLQ